MTPDDDMLMAYADGELDPLTAKRVERAIEADPALAKAVAGHRSLRKRLDGAFAPVAEEAVPAQLSAMLTKVVALPTRAAPDRTRWVGAAAIAAALVLAIGIVAQRPSTPGGAPLASAPLARALDTQLASTTGETRMLVSFRDRTGQYCRVFESPATDGIACREEDGWRLRRTQDAGPVADGAYRQAGSAEAELMAAAQNMMAGEPLDTAAEHKARETGWR